MTTGSPTGALPIEIGPGERTGDGDPLCAQAFLYDAESRRARSAPPATPRARGRWARAELPGWTNPFEGPRFLSEDGSRLFFESLDALLRRQTRTGKPRRLRVRAPGIGHLHEPRAPTSTRSRAAAIFLALERQKQRRNLPARRLRRRPRRLLLHPPTAGRLGRERKLRRLRRPRRRRLPRAAVEAPICLGRGLQAARGPDAPSTGPSPATAAFQGPGNASQGNARRCPQRQGAPQSALRQAPRQSPAAKGSGRGAKHDAQREERRDEGAQGIARRCSPPRSSRRPRPPGPRGRLPPRLEHPGPGRRRPTSSRATKAACRLPSLSSPTAAARPPTAARSRSPTRCRAGLGVKGVELLTPQGALRQLQPPAPAKPRSTGGSHAPSPATSTEACPAPKSRPILSRAKRCCYWCE